MAVPGGDFVSRTAYPGHGQGEKSKNAVRGRIPQDDLCKKLSIHLHFNRLILFFGSCFASGGGGGETMSGRGAFLFFEEETGFFLRKI